MAFFISSFRCAAVAHSLGTRSITSMTRWKRVECYGDAGASAKPEHLQHDGYATGLAGANHAFTGDGVRLHRRRIAAHWPPRRPGCRGAGMRADRRLCNPATLVIRKNLDGPNPNRSSVVAKASR